MYFPKLNSLRAIAILLVLIEHFATIIGSKISAGYYGVNLFFVLSGFLITSILIRENGHTKFKKWINFIARRSLRIFPVYYLTVLILIGLNYEPLDQAILYIVTYTYNYAWVYYDLPLSSISHFWSLAVEEQFYLVWPIIILSLLNFKRTLLILMIFIYVICSLQLTFNIFENVIKFNSVGLFPQSNSLALGGIGALICRNKQIPKFILDNKFLEYLLYVLLTYSLIFAGVEKYILCPIISLIFILKITTESIKSEYVNGILGSSKLALIGTISYGIYIFHLPLEYYFTKYIFDPFFWQHIPFEKLGLLAIIKYHSWIFKFPIYSILSIALAYLSFNYFEKPILVFKDKYFK